jgi:hypothetical protein
MGKLKIGDKVRIINSKKLVSIHNEKFIGQESEIYNIINNFVVLPIQNYILSLKLHLAYLLLLLH